MAQESYADRVACFKSISVGNLSIERKRVSGDIVIEDENGSSSTFRLIFTYGIPVDVSMNLAGLMLTMPVINFTFFSKKLRLDYPLSETDLGIISEFMKINAREVFINKICRRRYDFFKKEYLPTNEEINMDSADGRTELDAEATIKDFPWREKISDSSLVLSSGGKESLLTFAMLNDMVNDVTAYFFNESGGHWRTAKTSYDYFKDHFSKVVRVWSNVDRFYRFMLQKLPVLDSAVVRKRADTYPVQLFIFPVYIFAALPMVIKEGIGNILMGNEFDDPRDMPDYQGMKHYYGIYDQSHVFMDTMSAYLKQKGISSRLWSSVYPISGIMVEEILLKRYRDFFLQQRSCHSCRTEEGTVKPCGNCTKCLGIMMFVLAGGGNPSDINYNKASIENLRKNVLESRMRIDPDELSYLKEKLWGIQGSGREYGHVRGIHILPWEGELLQSIPNSFKDVIAHRFNEYCEGTFRTDGQKWIKTTQK